MICKDNAEHYLWGQNCDGWHLVKSANLSVIHERMPPNTSEARHYHNASHQFFFVLSGIVTLEIAGKREILRSHQGAEVPPGVPHQMFNESEHEIEFIVISQPAGRDDRVFVGSDKI